MTILSSAVLVGALVLAAVVVVLIVVYLLSRRNPEPEVEDLAGSEPLETRELALLRSIDRKLTAVNLAAIFLLLGWVASCVLVVLTLILGTGFLARLFGLQQLLR